VKNVLDGALQALALAVETREQSIAGHHRRVSELATAIARKMGLPADAVENIRMAALVHDVGKMAVPIEILAKTTGLTEMEYDFVKTHARRGYDMLKQAGLPYPLPEIVLQHHERVNGSGYPQGLKGREMLPEALILAVADAVEAAISHRPHRQGHGLEAAIDELRTNQDVLYEANAARACMELLTDKTFRLR
jgi:putative nucleotidyltransferase with HDIG domain